MTAMEKTGLYIALLIILALTALIVFSQKGYLDYRELKKEEALILEQSKSADMVNKKLENEIKSLKTDLEYIKHVAKHEHDMAEQGELIFKDKPVSKGKEQ